MPIGEFTVATSLIPKYNDLNRRAEALLDKYNPCAISKGTCVRGRSGGTNFCCKGCSYLGLEGCTVDHLQCSLWFCDYALIPAHVRESFKKEMWEIFLEAEELNLLVFRGSKVDSIRNACAIAMKKKAAQKEYVRRSHIEGSKNVGKTPWPYLESALSDIGRTNRLLEVHEKVEEKVLVETKKEQPQEEVAEEGPIAIAKAEMKDPFFGWLNSD